MARETDTILNGPTRIQTRLVKRRVGQTEPYEIIETDSWHEPSGEEITDQQRIAELTTRQLAEEKEHA